MKRLSVFFIAGIFCLTAVAAGAENVQVTEKDSPLSFNSTFDLALDPEAERRPGATHFSHLVSPYEMIEARFRFNIEYKLLTPLGENALLKDSNVVLKAVEELTPINCRQVVQAAFTPVPFLVFSAGASIGTGWHIDHQFGGLRKVNVNTGKYEDLTTFKNFYYDFYGEALFQFDTGEVFPGDWNHVQLLASYNAAYKKMTGLKKGEAGKWSGTDNFASGWLYDSIVVLAYKMPCRFYRAGVMSEFWGHYNADDYGEAGCKENFNGSYMTVSIAPFTQAKVTEKDNITLLAEFQARRAFKEEHFDYSKETQLHYTGREWYLMRIAVQWEHRF